MAKTITVRKFTGGKTKAQKYKDNQKKYKAARKAFKLRNRPEIVRSKSIRPKGKKGRTS